MWPFLLVIPSTEPNVWMHTYNGDLNRQWYIFYLKQQDFKMTLIPP